MLLDNNTLLLIQKQTRIIVYRVKYNLIYYKINNTFFVWQEVSLALLGNALLPFLVLLIIYNRKKLATHTT